MTTVTSSSPSLYAAKAPIVTTINNIGIEDALKAVRLQSNVKVNITDSVANIKKYLGALTGIVNNVGTITQSSSDLSTTSEKLFSLTASQYTSYSKVLTKLTSFSATSFHIALSGVSAAAAIGYNTNDRIQTISVTDSSTNIGASIEGLKGVLDNNKLGTITQSGTATPISLTRTIYEANSAVLGKIGTAYTVAISGVTAAQAVDYARTVEPLSPATRLSLASLAINAHIGAISIIDSTGGIESNLDDLQKLGVRLKTISVDDTGVALNSATATNGKIDLTAAQVKGDAIVIGKIISSYQLAVHGASLAQSTSLSTNKKVVTIDIVDRGANIVKSLATLNKLGSQLSSVTVTDSDNSLAMTDAQLVTYDTLLGKFSGTYGIDVAGSSALNAKLLLAATGSYLGTSGSHINSISIADTAEHISNYFDGLNAQSKVSKVNVLDLKAPIVLTAAQLAAADTLGVDSVLSKIAGGYSLKITDVAAADAVHFSGSSGFNSHITAITVTDNAYSIEDKLSDLTALGGKLESIVQTDRVVVGTTPAVDFELGYAAWTTHKATLEKVVGNYSAILTNVSAGAAASVAADSHISALSVSDTGAEISKNFDALISVGSKLNTLSQSDTVSLKASNLDKSSLAITAAQYTAGAVLLDKFTGSGTAAYALSVTGMTVDQVLDITTPDQVVSATVLDTSANIASNLDAIKLRVTSGLVSSITQQGIASTLAITATQLASDANVLGKLTGNYSLSVSGVAVGDAAALLASNSHVSSVSVNGTSAEITSNLAALKALGKKLTAIVSSNSLASVTVTGMSAISSGYLSVNGQNIGAIAVASTVPQRVTQLVSAINAKSSLTGVTASVDAGDSSKYTLVAADGRSISITSSAVSPQSSVSGFNIGTYQNTFGFSLSSEDYANYRLTLDKLVGNYTVNLTGVSVDQVATFAADTHVATVAIADTAARISGKFDTLRNFVPKIQSINDGPAATTATALNLTASQYALGTALLAKINYAGTTVKGVTVAVAQTLKTADVKVSSVTVTDTSAKIAENLDDLQANSKVTAITQSGTIAPLSITRAQLTSDAGTLDKITGNYSLRVSGVAAATVGTVDGAKDLLANNRKVAAVSVTATAEDIANNMANLAKLGSKLAGLVQSDPANAINLTDASLVANKAVLDKIDGYRLNVSAVSAARAMALAGDDRVVSLDITATSAEVSTYFDALKTVLPKILGINKPASGSAPVTALALSATQYAQGGALFAKIGDYTASVKGASAAYAQTLAGDSHVPVLSVSVADNSANVAQNLNNLQANTKVSGVILEDVSVPLHVTETQRTADATLLGLIAGNWSMNVAGVAAANAATVNTTAHVASFSVSTSAAGVETNLTGLVGSSKLSSITLSVAGSPLSLTAATLLNTGTLATLQKIDNGYSLAVSAATMANLPNLAVIDNISSIKVADNSLHLSDQFDDLIDLGSQLTEVTNSTASTPLALTYDQWAAGADTLGKITSGNYMVDLFDVAAANVATLAASSKVDEIYVEDYSYNIASQWGALVSQAKLTTITLLDNGDISLTQAQQALTGSGALIDKLQGTYSIVDAD